VAQQSPNLGAFARIGRYWLADRLYVLSRFYGVCSPSQHDAQMDYYGKRLATCSSDRSVKVFDVPASGEPVFVADLKGCVAATFVCAARVGPCHPRYGSYLTLICTTVSLFCTGCVCRHEGPVWEVAWAHPKFGVLLASCSYDRKVVIYREIEHTWSTVHIHNFHASSGKGGVALVYRSCPTILTSLVWRFGFCSQRHQLGAVRIRPHPCVCVLRWQSFSDRPPR
jgi:WD40 repeat protein